MAGEFTPFPEKLRVLVVDDDPVCVKIISQMLKHCNYEVTEVEKATEALETLKKNPKSFDMVITDTYNDIDVVSLIVDILKIENIAVILVSGLDDTSTLINGVVEGADEILSKPVSLAKVKTLWQHVFRRRLKKGSSNSEVELDSKSKVCVGPSSSTNDDDDDTDEDNESEHKKKKARVRWTGSLQEKFMKAVWQLGGPVKAMPKKIMEMMDESDISRESVASHLQKYRKQKKPLVFPNHNTTTSTTTAFPPFSPHSCYRNMKMTPRFGYHHRNPGFQYRPHCNFMGPRQNAPYCSSSNSSLWAVPKGEIQYGSHVYSQQQFPAQQQLPAQQQFMLPPLPNSVVPMETTNIPIPPPVPQPINSFPCTTTDQNNSSLSFFEEAWNDSNVENVFDESFFADVFNPESQEELYTNQFGIGGDGAGASAQQY